MRFQQIVGSSLSMWFVLFCLCNPVAAAKWRVLYVDSYHESYPWSAGITAGIRSVLDEHQEIELKIFRMDTKRQSSEEAKISAAERAKESIERWQPNLVIISDDNAAKYLLVPYFHNSSLPFVFCGINGDANGYHFNRDQVTGMVEVQLIDQILAALGSKSANTRIAFIKGDDLSAHKEARFFEQRFNLKLDQRFVTNFAEWQREYVLLQQQADMILLGNSASIDGWDARAARAFILQNTRVPTGNWDVWMAPYSLVTLANLPEEQGEWAANAAVKILNGISPAAIPIATNHKAAIYLNMELAKKLGIKFPMELIERATFTAELDQP